MRKGSQQTPEARKKISLGNRGKPKSPEHVAAIKAVWGRKMKARALLKIRLHAMCQMFEARFDPASPFQQLLIEVYQLSQEAF
jgi:hypothetical protein